PWRESGTWGRNDRRWGPRVDRLGLAARGHDDRVDDPDGCPCTAGEDRKDQVDYMDVAVVEIVADDRHPGVSGLWLNIIIHVHNVGWLASSVRMRRMRPRPRWTGWGLLVGLRLRWLHGGSLSTIRNPAEGHSFVPVV